MNNARNVNATGYQLQIEEFTIGPGQTIMCVHHTGGCDQKVDLIEGSSLVQAIAT